MTGELSSTSVGEPQRCTTFGPMHQDERKRLKLNSQLSALDGVSLALSGGGIRAASFALGVVQTFMNADVWRRFDYLSTVSGGGYFGCALSWWMHQAVTDPELEALAPDRRYAEKVPQKALHSPQRDFAGLSPALMCSSVLEARNGRLEPQNF